MKKLLAAALAALLLSACGREPAAPVSLPAGEWPDNACTEGLPALSGKWVSGGAMDPAGQWCSVTLYGVPEEDFCGFREELEALGFAEIADAEEPVRYPDGKEGPVSENALLTDGERSVSLSCQDGAGSLLISREKTE